MFLLRFQYFDTVLSFSTLSLVGGVNLFVLLPAQATFLEKRKKHISGSAGVLRIS